MLPSLKSMLVNGLVQGFVVGAIVTSTLVAGRIYGPTYYNEDHGNGQPAAQNQGSSQEGYGLYYNAEDKNYYYRHQHDNQYDPNDQYYQDQNSYNYDHVDRQLDAASDNMATRIINVGQGMWNMVRSGIRRMSSGLRKALGGDTSERQGVQDIIASNAWTLPLAGVATGVLFREQIQDLIDDLAGPCAEWRNVCDDKDVDTCKNGDCFCGTASKCAGTSDTCTSGSCKCGTTHSCTDQDVDTCKKGKCTCGGSAACYGTTDTCSSGTCKCGTYDACTGTKVCKNGKCGCGADTDCTGTSNRCDTATGECKCGDLAAVCDSAEAEGKVACLTSAQAVSAGDTTGMTCQCDATSCHSIDTANICTAGVCKCGGDALCSATTPYCTKLADGTKAADDDATAATKCGCTGAIAANTAMGSCASAKVCCFHTGAGTDKAYMCDDGDTECKTS